MFAIFLNAFTMVFFAEMGDKTQILAMSLAAKYPLKKVITGIAIGVLANHSLAVALGYFLGRVLPMDIIGVLAGALFVFFGLMSFKVEEEEEEADRPMKFSVVGTIAVAFFIGELGDKTQITATALATQFASPLVVLAGTFTAMMATAAIGIAIGLLLGKNLPEMLIKVVSGFVFVGFGTQKLMQTVSFLTTPLGIIVYSLVLGTMLFWMIRPTYIIWRSGQLMPMQKMGEELRQMQEELKHYADGLCRTESVCGTCEGAGCIVGQIKLLIQALDQHDDIGIDSALSLVTVAVDKHFNYTIASEGLKRLMAFHTTHPELMAEYSSKLLPIEERLTRLTQYSA